MESKHEHNVEVQWMNTRKGKMYSPELHNFEAHYNKTLKVLEKAKKACLISNSVKSELFMFPQIKMLQQEAV